MLPVIQPETRRQIEEVLPIAKQARKLVDEAMETQTLRSYVALAKMRPGETIRVHHHDRD